MRVSFCVATWGIGLYLPAVMRKCLVGLRHAIHVVLALERPTLLVDGVQDLGGESLDHLALAALPRERDDPAHGERPCATGRHLDGYLVVGAADAARAHLERGRDGLDGLLQHLERGPAGTLFDARERAVDDLLGRRLLAADHDPVDHLADERRGVKRVCGQDAGRDFCSARHRASSSWRRTWNAPACD